MPPARPLNSVGVASPVPEPAHDAVLVAVCGLVLAGILFGVFRPSAPSTPGGALPPVIGKLTQQVKDVRRRSDGVLVWSDIHRGDLVRDGDGLYVGEGAAATVEMTDGSLLTLDDKSMVILHPALALANAAQLPAVDLVRGGAAGVARQSPLAIRASGAAVQLAQGGQASVRLRADRSLAVAVPQGSAQIRLSDGSQAGIGAHQRRVVDGRSKRIGMAEAMGPELLEPVTAARLFVRPHADPVLFAWKPVANARGYTLELSRDAEFGRVLATSTREPAVQQKLAAGLYYWRVWVQLAQGRRVSEERAVMLVDDAPAVPYRPTAGQSLDLSKEHRVALEWVAVPGVRHYVVELGLTDDRPTEHRAEGPSLMLAAEGGPAWREGTYCYRVRADEAERGSSPWSERSCFRVITKPVLKAPKLFDPSHPQQGALPPQMRNPAWGRAWTWSWAHLLGGVAQAAEVAEPAGGSKPASIVLRWEAIGGAAKYQVDIAQDLQFAQGNSSMEVATNALRWQPPAFADYFWRVRAVDAEGRLGDVSDTRSIVLVGKPAELSGGEGTVVYGQSLPEVTLRWQGRGPSSEVWVEVARDAAMAQGLRSEPVQDANHWSFRASAPGPYYWRVAQRLEGGRRGPVSPVRKFTVRPAAPEGLEPNASGKNAQNPNDLLTLHWSLRAAVDGYEVELSPDRSFKKPQLIAAKKNAASLPPQAPGTTFWRVRCRAPTSDWSAVASWTVAALAPATPVVSAPPPAAPPPVVVATPVAPLPLDPWASPGADWARVYAGLAAAFYVNFGGVPAPRVHAEAGWRTPWGPGQIGAALSAGYYTAATQATSADHRVGVRARMNALPIDVVGLFVWPLRWLNVSAAAGLRCVVNFNQVTASTVNGPSTNWSSTAVNVGGLIAGGAERPWGPGAAFGELSLAWTSRTTGLVQNDGSGFAVTLGYRMRVF